VWIVGRSAEEEEKRYGETAMVAPSGRGGWEGLRGRSRPTRVEILLLMPLLRRSISSSIEIPGNRNHTEFRNRSYLLKEHY